MVKRIIVLVVLVSMVAVGCALTLKGAIGVGAWDALASTISGKLGIPFGTMGMFLNFCCIGLQMLILKKEFKKVQYLQFVVSILFGYVVNFVLYELFSGFVVTEYYINVSLLVIGQIICAFAVGAVMVIDMVTFPLEGACMAVSNKLGKKFHVVRQLVDVISVMAVLLLVFTLGMDLTVREGTIIGALIFGPIMGIFMRLLKPIFKRTNLIYREV